MVSLNGMTVKEADSYMRRKLGQIYSVDGEDAKSEIKLTLGNIRTIQVNMMGEVANPGTYYLSSLSNLYHALHRAGGVSALGSLRDIQLIRKGKVISHVDIYEFIRNGKMENTILEEGDIINVPTYRVIVDITGNVKRPMSYELKEGETIADLISYAAGFTGDAYVDNVRLIRKNGKEYQIHTIDQAQYADFRLVEGDALAVGAMLDRFANRIEVKGAVYRPGTYELGNGIETVSQLIRKAEGLKGDAFTNRALLTREREDLTLEIIPVDIKAVLNGSAADVKLSKNDVLYIPSIHDLQDLGSITVGGEVAKPGTFVYTENTTLEDAIMLAGGLLESASTVKIDVSRRIKNPASTEQSETIGEVYTFSFKDGYVLDGKAGFVLQPYDQIHVRRSPGYVTQSTVSISGEVVFPGSYVMTQKEERLSDLVSKSGGLNT
jgi:protein involved in polysaccharide export with SLBB domain